MLVSKFDFRQRESLVLSALTLINKDNYAEAGRNASLLALFPQAGLFKGDYADFEKKREQLFELNRLDENRYRETLLSAVWLGDNGYKALSACFDAVLNSGDGFREIHKVGGPNRVSIQFLWSSSTDRDSVEILDSSLENGHVEGAPAGKLLPPADKAKGHPPLVVSKASVPIVIIRDKIDEPVYITLSTSLQRQPDEIRIDPVLPERPVYWRFLELQTDASGQVMQFTPTPIDTRGDQWNYAIPAPVGYVFAEKPSAVMSGGDNTRILSCNLDVSNTVFTRAGETHSNPRYLNLTYKLGQYVDDASCIARAHQIAPRASPSDKRRGRTQWRRDARALRDFDMDGFSPRPLR